MSRELEIGRQLARSRTRRLSPHDRAMAFVTARPELKAALFQFVDVAPACDGPADLAEHLAALLDGLARPGPPVRLARHAARARPTRAVTGRVAAAAVRHMADRFIAGATPELATSELGRLWRRGRATSVDLLGEATLTRAEGAAYARRCDAALVTLARAAAGWPEQPALEHDRAGPIPRTNLSIKVTALTPLIRPAAPERGREDAASHLRALLRRAKEVGAHLHVDMESLDSREAVLELALDVLAEDEFRDGPSAGVVLQAYLRDTDERLEQILDRVDRTPRTVPLTVRLVKGAYWDQERVQAGQHGWPAPVWEEKADCDRCFERATRRLIEAFPAVRPAIASHNLRSVAHAIAAAERAGLAPADLELQVLRGLGDELGDALARAGYRGRTYCPVGDLVNGMAYLVRRLLENTSNDSFLAEQAAGADLDELLRAP